MRLGRDLSAERQAQAFAVSQVAPMFPLYLIMLLVLTFYLLDCLYAERKDRSILFWKSLPVSDGLTVLSKFLVAVVVVPLGVLVLAAVCHVLLFMVWQLGVATGRLPDVLTWSTAAVVQGRGRACSAACCSGRCGMPRWPPAFLLVSAWARRSPIMWVTLAPIVAMVVEWKIGTHYVASFLYYRTFGIWEILGASAHGERLGHGARLEAVLGRSGLRRRLHQPEPVARGAGDRGTAVRHRARAPLPGRHLGLSAWPRGARELRGEPERSRAGSAAAAQACTHTVTMMPGAGAVDQGRGAGPGQSRRRAGQGRRRPGRPAGTDRAASAARTSACAR